MFTYSEKKDFKLTTKEPSQNTINLWCVAQATLSPCIPVTAGDVLSRMKWIVSERQTGTVGNINVSQDVIAGILTAAAADNDDDDVIRSIHLNPAYDNCWSQPLLYTRAPNPIDAVAWKASTYPVMPEGYQPPPELKDFLTNTAKVNYLELGIVEKRLGAFTDTENTIIDQALSLFKQHHIDVVTYMYGKKIGLPFQQRQYNAFNRVLKLCICKHMPPDTLEFYIGKLLMPFYNRNPQREWVIVTDNDGAITDIQKMCTNRTLPLPELVFLFSQHGTINPSWKLHFLNRRTKTVHVIGIYNDSGENEDGELRQGIALLCKHVFVENVSTLITTSDPYSSPPENTGVLAALWCNMFFNANQQKEGPLTLPPIKTMGGHDADTLRKQMMIDVLCQRVYHSDPLLAAPIKTAAANVNKAKEELGSAKNPPPKSALAEAGARFASLFVAQPDPAVENATYKVGYSTNTLDVAVADALEARVIQRAYTTVINGHIEDDETPATVKLAELHTAISAQIKDDEETTEQLAAAGMDVKKAAHKNAVMTLVLAYSNRFKAYKVHPSEGAKADTEIAKEVVKAAVAAAPTEAKPHAPPKPRSRPIEKPNPPLRAGDPATTDFTTPAKRAKREVKLTEAGLLQQQILAAVEKKRQADLKKGIKVEESEEEEEEEYVPPAEPSPPSSASSNSTAASSVLSALGGTGPEQHVTPDSSNQNDGSEQYGSDNQDDYDDGE